MKCEDCGTEDPGAPSYKPACLIERDMLRAELQELGRWHLRAVDEANTMRAVLRSVEWSGGHCPECGAVQWSDEPEDKTHNPGCALHAALAPDGA